MELISGGIRFDICKSVRGLQVSNLIPPEINSIMKN